MIGEENEKKDIDEETALENNPRLTELAGLRNASFRCRIFFFFFSEMHNFVLLSVQHR